jgi:Repeat of unknown function (DUF5648)
LNTLHRSFCIIFALCCARFAHAQVATVVEYYSPSLDAYFITGRPAEQTTLNASVGFQRTGMTFQAMTAASAQANMPLVCRYYISTISPFSSSHFYGTTGYDCELIAASRPAGFSYEGFDFAVQKPSNTLGCSGAWPYPVYRSFRAAANGTTANHRYSTSLASYNALLQRGWIGEGATFCATSATDIQSNVALSPAGIWFGRSSNGGSNVYGVVAPSGETWVLYTDVAGQNFLSGVVFANISWAGGSYSAAARDFYFAGRNYADARVNGNYVARSQLSGTVFYPSLNQSSNFNSSFNAVYDLTPSLAAITGTYSGSGTSLYGTEKLALAIQSDGVAVAVTASGCTFSGRVSPMTGANLYRVNVISQGAQCNGTTINVTGVGYFDPAYRQLVITTTDVTRTNAFVYIGTKN